MLLISIACCDPILAPGLRRGWRICRVRGPTAFARGRRRGRGLLRAWCRRHGALHRERCKERRARAAAGSAGRRIALRSGCHGRCGQRFLRRVFGELRYARRLNRRGNMRRACFARRRIGGRRDRCRAGRCGRGAAPRLLPGRHALRDLCRHLRMGAPGDIERIALLVASRWLCPLARTHDPVCSIPTTSRTARLGPILAGYGNTLKMQSFPLPRGHRSLTDMAEAGASHCPASAPAEAAEQVPQGSADWLAAARSLP